MINVKQITDNDIYKNLVKSSFKAKMKKLIFEVIAFYMCVTSIYFRISKSFLSKISKRSHKWFLLENVLLFVVVSIFVFIVQFVKISNKYNVYLEDFKEKLCNSLGIYKVNNNILNIVEISEILDKEISDDKNKTKSICLLLLKFNNYGIICNMFDNNIGEYILKNKERVLKKFFPEFSYKIGRISKEEFVILIFGVQKINYIINISRKILNIFRKPLDINGDKICMDINIGISMYPKYSQSSTELMKNANIALYNATKVGNGIYQFYSPKLGEEIKKDISIEAELQSALDNNEFIVYYQPQINLKSNTINSMEALIRWNHPTRGLIPPSQFIHIAEKTGFIISIDEWVIRTVCMQYKEWIKNGYKPIRMSVNMSPKLFKIKNLPEKIENILKDTNMDPEFLEIEITETIGIYDITSTVDKLNKIKKLGVRIVLDDFGKGYSSLSYLTKFPINKLKLDQSFARNIFKSDMDKEIIKSTINLAHSLNMEVTTEGVETRGQLFFLEKNGCDNIQGYYYSKPKPPNEIEKFIKRQQR